MTTSISYSKQATSLVMRTVPFLGVNALVYGVFFVASVIWFGFWGALALLMAKLDIGIMAAVFVLIGFGAGAGIVKFARRYLLYLVKGAHIAAMTELLKGGALPQGMGQYEYSKQIVQRHFKDMSVLFALDTMVDASLRALQRKVLRVTGWLPLPEGAQSAVRMITEILNQSLTYVDEAILSYAIYRGEENIWASAKHGVILYAQSYKAILMTAVKVWGASKIVGFALFLLFLLPALVVIVLAKSYVVVQVVAVILALVAAWAVKAALFEPFALAYTLVTYHHTIAGQVPDPAWDERLSGASDKFRELTSKASQAMPKPFYPAPAPATITAGPNTASSTHTIS